MLWCSALRSWCCVGGTTAAAARWTHACLPPGRLPPPPHMRVQLADLVESLLVDRPALAAVGRRAQAKARSWAEADNAEALVGHVRQALDNTLRR